MRVNAFIATALWGCGLCAAHGQDAEQSTAQARADLEALTTKDLSQYQTPLTQFPWNLTDGIERARIGSALFSPPRFITLFEPREIPVKLHLGAPQAGAYGFSPDAPLFADPLDFPLRPARNLEQFLYEGLSSSTNIFYTLLLQGLSRTADDPSGDPYQKWSGTGRIDVNLQTVFAKSHGLGTSMLQVLFREGVVIGAPGSYTSGAAAGTFFNANALSMGDTASLKTIFLEQGFLDDRFAVSVGKLSVNNYFMVNYFADDESSQFLNGSLDGNDVFAAGFNNHFPGVLLQGIPCDDIYVNFGVFDIGSDSASSIEFLQDGLYFAVLEVGYTPKGDADITRYSATVAVTNQGRDWEMTGEKQSNLMLGLMAQRRLNNNLAPFFEWAIGSNENISASMELSLGVGIFSPLGRSDDYAGIAASWAQPTTPYGDLPPSLDPPSTQVLEAFYRVQLTDSMQLSPDLQVFLNPQNGDDSPVVAFSLRLKTQF